LTDAAVMEMRRLRASGTTIRRLCELFSVTRTTATNAVRGVTWKHLPLTSSPIDPTATNKLQSNP
jgi:hypothetical protein